MSSRKITELPIHETPDNFSDMVVSVERVYKRVSVSDHVVETEEKAIEKVKEIYKSGRKAFIIAYAN